MKSAKRIEARHLRNRGFSIKTIAKQLQVSQSTVSLWVRDIVLSESQIRKLQEQNPIINAQISGNKTISSFKRNERLQYQNEGKITAKTNNLLHQAGCMLYWAEGAKNKNSLVFTNSDVNMMKLFIKFLRECFQLTNERFNLRINCYTTNGLTTTDIENYWLKELDLNRENLRKGQQNIRPRSVTNTVRHHKLMYGVCSLTVTRSTPVVQHIFGAIQEYANFSTNYVLD